MAKIERKIDLLMKAMKERDHEIVVLRDQIKACEIVESSQTSPIKANDRGNVVLQENQVQQYIFIASLSVQQLYNMITCSIWA